MAQVLNFPKRPRFPTWAVWLLYGAVGFGMVKYVLILGVAPDDAPYPLADSFRFGLEISIWLLFTFLVSIGHSWTRYVLAALVALEAFGAAYGVSKGIVQADLFMMLTNLMRIVGVVLLFTRQTSDWFAAMKQARRDLKATMAADKARLKG